MQHIQLETVQLTRRFITIVVCAFVIQQAINLACGMDKLVCTDNELNITLKCDFTKLNWPRN